MAERVTAFLRLLVATRADALCEYCLIAEEDTFFGCEVDHILSVKHGGQTESDNLAYACAFCNRYKGSDIASLSQPTGALVRFFNPRLDRWSEHFQLRAFSIMPLTEIGDATARILRFNDSTRILERQELIIIGRYPNAAAMLRIKG
jgi:hypothetical protein